MSDITFGELPPIVRTKTRQPQYADVAAAARGHSGEWTLLGNISATSVKAINDGQWEEFTPAGHYQAASRNSQGGKADVYVTYLGTEPDVD